MKPKSECLICKNPFINKNPGRRPGLTCSIICEGKKRRFTDEQKEESFKRRFFEKIDKKSINECWLWKGFRNKKGYGSLMHTKENGQVQAHRASWMIHYGEIPNGLIIMHSVCDNPPCCNPNHLQLGTIALNQQDMVNKGRQKKGNAGIFGSNSYSAKITEDIALKIIESLKNEKAIRIAKELNVSKYIVYDIKRKKTWKHIKLES